MEMPFINDAAEAMVPGARERVRKGLVHCVLIRWASLGMRNQRGSIGYQGCAKCVRMTYLDEQAI